MSNKLWLLVAGVAGWLVILLLAAAMMMLGGDSTTPGTSSDPTNAAALDNGGMPVDAAGLEAFYARPQSNDATAAWLAAIEPLSTQSYLAETRGIPIVDSENANVPLPGRPWPQREASERLIEKHAATLRQLHAAARQGGQVRYPIDFEQGYAAFLPHLTGLGMAARLLTLESHVHAHRGDTHAAAKSLLTTVAMAETLRDEPLIISQLTRILCMMQAWDQLERRLGSPHLSDEDLRAIQNAIGPVGFARGLERGLIGDRISAIHCYDHPQSYADLTQPIPAWQAYKEADLQNYLHFMQLASDAARLPFPAAYNQVADAENALFVQIEATPPREKLQFVLTVQLTGNIKNQFAEIALATARQFAADAAIAAELFRRQQGRLPQRLDELVPAYLAEVPSDPFASGELKLAIFRDHYSIFSVGADRNDNRDAPRGPGNDDIGMWIDRSMLEQR